jgi:hypothetical protein
VQQIFPGKGNAMKAGPREAIILDWCQSWLLLLREDIKWI